MGEEGRKLSLRPELWLLCPAGVSHTDPMLDPLPLGHNLEGPGDKAPLWPHTRLPWPAQVPGAIGVGAPGEARGW